MAEEWLEWASDGGWLVEVCNQVEVEVDGWMRGLQSGSSHFAEHLDHASLLAWE